MRHHLGKKIAPLRRTPGGFLDFDRLDAYTEYLRCKEGGEEPSQEILSRLTPNSLLPSQSAVFHRLGLSDTIQNESIWIPSFYPKNFALFHNDDLYNTGRRAIVYFTQEFVKAKWPQASTELQSRLMELYHGKAGLLGLAKQHGINKCIVNILGWHMEPLPTSVANLNERTRQMVFPRERVNLKLPPEDPDAISWTVTGLIGAAWKTFGGRQVRKFLDSKLFSAGCSMLQTFQPDTPMLELTELLRETNARHENLKFKLLSESGRLSTNSMYIVGVYDGLDNKLGEGNGPSILLSQKRACIDALRKIYLREAQSIIRPSDTFSDDVYGERVGISVN